MGDMFEVFCSNFWYIGTNVTKVGRLYNYVKGCDKTPQTHPIPLSQSYPQIMFKIWTALVKNK